jgi:hypothetical protein
MKNKFNYDRYLASTTELLKYTAFKGFASLLIDDALQP